MFRSKMAALKSAVLALAVVVPATGALFVAPVPVMAAMTLPAPYVSRALDAVLMPVEASVAATFGLAAGTTGVLVIATDPAGIAASAGIEPGDVIDFVQGEAILSPADLDEVVYYWILQNAFDFELNAVRAGKPFKAATVVTLEEWEEVIEITTVESWTSYSYESFSYSEYYTEYSEEMTVSYEEAETSVEEAALSEEFEADMQAEDEGFAEDEAGMAEEECDPDVNPDCAEDVAADEDAVEEDAAEDGGDEVGGDEELVE